MEDNLIYPWVKKNFLTVRRQVNIALSGIKGDLYKSSGSLVKTLQVGTLQVM